MYEVKLPKVHLSTVLGYDIKKKEIYLSDEDRVFEDEDELVLFLAEGHKQLHNWLGKPIPGRYKNKFMDFQALNGISRKGYNDYDLELSTRTLQFTSIDVCWKVNKYLFWIDAPGSPNFDVRMLKKKVDAVYEEQIAPDKYAYRINRLKMKFQNNHVHKQGRKSHKCYPWREDARYIHRARAAYGMKVEEEYRDFSKPKDRDFKSIWANEEFGGYHSTGWKDNSGSRCRHQWEAKAKRDFKKVKRKKDIAMFSGGRPEYRKVVRSQKELEEELEALRKEFGC